MKIDINQEVLKKWGVYKVTNLINNEIYIGSTSESFQKRIWKHMSDYLSWKNKMKKSSCPILYNSFKKYGIDNFKVEVLFYFNRKKDSKTNERIVRYLEERFIRSLKPGYNICQFPTRGGIPNLGRKLSKEWKQKISEKSKLYKHSKEVYQKKLKQNKQSKAIYRIENENFLFEGTLAEISQKLNVSESSVYKWKNNKNNSERKFKITRLKSQKKSIKLYSSDEEIILHSFGECDRFLNMWKGFTSTKILQKSDKLLEYKYELL